MKLNELKVAKSAVITKVSGQGALRQHFLDMGMVPGAEITLIKTAPMGDPLEYQIHGYELTLRLAEAEKIEIEPIAKRSRSHTGINREQNIDHPGLGEDGKYHSKRMKNRLMTMLFLPMPWLEIKIAEKQLFLISLPEQSKACRQLSRCNGRQKRRCY